MGFAQLRGLVTGTRTVGIDAVFPVGITARWKPLRSDVNQTRGTPIRSMAEHVARFSSARNSPAKRHRDETARYGSPLPLPWCWPATGIAAPADPRYDARSSTPRPDWTAPNTEPSWQVPTYWPWFKPGVPGVHCKTPTSDRAHDCLRHLDHPPQVRTGRTGQTSGHLMLATQQLRTTGPESVIRPRVDRGLGRDRPQRHRRLAALHVSLKLRHRRGGRRVRAADEHRLCPGLHRRQVVKTQSGCARRGVDDAHG